MLEEALRTRRIEAAARERRLGETAALENQVREAVAPVLQERGAVAPVRQERETVAPVRQEREAVAPVRQDREAVAPVFQKREAQAPDSRNPAPLSRANLRRSAFRRDFWKKGDVGAAPSILDSYKRFEPLSELEERINSITAAVHNEYQTANAQVNHPMINDSDRNVLLAGGSGKIFVDQVHRAGPTMAQANEQGTGKLETQKDKTQISSFFEMDE